MNRVLSKRILRELKRNFLRYLALLLLIAMGMYIVTAMIASADTIIYGTEENSRVNHLEDGQFAVFTGLTSGQEQEISDMGVTLEKMFSFDVPMDDGSDLRIFRNREKIDIVYITDGRAAQAEGEICLEKRYCEEHNISVGDVVDIGGSSLAVTGIGTALDYDAPTKKISDPAVQSKLFGIGFVTPGQYDILKSFGRTEDMRYAYRLGEGVSRDALKEKIKSFKLDTEDISDEFLREMTDEKLQKKEDIERGISELKNGSEELTDGLSELDKNSAAVAQFAPKYAAGVGAAYDGAAGLAEGIVELQSETGELLDEIFRVDIDNLTEFIEAGDNPRIAACAGDVVMNKNIGMLAGIIFTALIAYVISVFVVHQIQQESGVIGALYAMGAKKGDLIFHYVLLPALISLAGGIAGTAIGLSSFGMNSITGDSYSYYSLPVYRACYPAYLIFYGILMPPVISAAVNVLVINKSLSRTALSLIKNEQAASMVNRVKEIDLGNMGFIRRFQIRQLIREARTGLTVIAGMLISMLILMIGINCFVMCRNFKDNSAADAAFEYMYTLKYPGKDAPEEAEKCYMETLSMTDRGYTLEVSIIGIDSDNKYYAAVPEKGKNKVVIGSAAAQKYGLHKGDRLILTDSAGDTDYVFTITDTADYAVGLAAFMDIESMRELFGKDDDHYNVLLSDTALDIEEGRIYAVTSREDIVRSSEVFTDLMMPMVIMMTAVSAVIFCVVLFLMMNVMIDRAAFGISLVKIFGFSTGEVRRLYLNGNTAVVAVGAAVCLPLSKLIMDKLYPGFIANVACGMDIAFPPYLYAGLFCGIMAVYFAVNAVLVGKVKKISPAEALKNRE